MLIGRMKVLKASELKNKGVKFIITVINMNSRLI